MERTHVCCYAVNFRLSSWDERRAKIILRWTIGGSARVSRAGSGVAPESSLDKSVWETVFGATPKTATGTVALPVAKRRYDNNWRLNFLSREGREGGEVRRTGIFVETAA